MLLIAGSLEASTRHPAMKSRNYDSGPPTPGGLGERTLSVADSLNAWRNDAA